MGFPTMWYVRQTRLRPACAYAQSDQSLCKSLEHSMTVKLLTEQYLGFQSLKEGCTGSFESIFVKMRHCWKSHVTAQICLIFFNKPTMGILNKGTAAQFNHTNVCGKPETITLRENAVFNQLIKAVRAANTKPCTTPLAFLQI